MKDSNKRKVRGPKLSQIDFLDHCSKTHFNKYDYSLVVYKGSQSKISIICPIHGQFEQTAREHFRGAGCIECCVDKRRKSPQKFIEQAKSIHGEKYDYSLINYTKNCNNIEILCPKHGIFKQTPAVHLDGYGCQKCGNENQTKTLEQFLKEAKKVHGEKYDYSKAVYINYNTKLNIICPIHGEFSQSPGAHLHGSACKQCGFKKLAKTKRKSEELFLERSKNVHKNLYDYSKVNYLDGSTKVEILCSIHGSFFQAPNVHIKGHGCNECAVIKNANNNRGSLENFISKASVKHNNKYDYSQSVYINCDTKVSIICPLHGNFLQSPYSHLGGSGCSKCGFESVKKKNQEVSQGWHYTNWEKAAKASKDFDSFKVYIIKCWNENELFYKIGKTFNTVKKRFRHINTLPYFWEVVKIFESENAKEICLLERKLIQKNKEYKYLPQIHFSGKYECFYEVNYE